MLPSIPQENWLLHAHDPLALTRTFLDLPEIIVTGLMMPTINDCSSLVNMLGRSAVCPTCHQLSGQIHAYHLRTVRELAWVGMPPTFNLPRDALLLGVLLSFSRGTGVAAAL